MAISWGTIKSLIIFFGPLLLPKVLSTYRRIRDAPRRPDQAVRPVPSPVYRALFLLAGVALAFLLKALPLFSPENVFVLTQSRLKIPTDVLFTRLSALRPNGVLTPLDESLRARFVNVESRLLYLAFGPDALGLCPFCGPDDHRSYLTYALPDVLSLHLFNFGVLVLATSSWLTAGGSGSSSSNDNSDNSSGAPKWRSSATIASAVLAALDAYLVSSYNHVANSSAARLSDLDPFYWRARLHRLLALALLDLAIASLTYLSSTRRAFFDSPSPADRVDAAAKALGFAKGRLNAVAIVKNTASRDGALRARSQAYWSQEVGLMSEVMEDREVVEGVNDALSNRIDINTISRDAEAYARNMLENSVSGGGGGGPSKAEKSEKSE